MDRSRSLRSAAVLLALAGIVACGEDATPTVRAGAWSQTAPTEERLPELNEPPRIESVRFDPLEPMPGGRLRAIATASDPEGDPISLAYRWSMGGATLLAKDAELELGEGTGGARIEVEVVASDGLRESEPVSAGIHVTSRRPILTGLDLTPGGVVPQGAAVVATPEARDPDGDELTYRFEWNADGVVLENAGHRLSTASLEVGAKVQARVWASDGITESTPVYSHPVRVGSPAPEIVSTPGPVGADGVFRYTLETRHTGADRGFRYRLVRGPNRMRVDVLTGEVSWKPTLRDVGTHPVEVEVRDSQGTAVVQSFELRVDPPDPVPAALP